MKQFSALLALAASCIVTTAALGVDVCGYSVSRSRGFLCPVNGASVCKSVSTITGSCDSPLHCFGGPFFCNVTLIPKSGPQPQCPFSSQRLRGLRCVRQGPPVCRNGTLEAGGPGANLLDSATLLSALPIVNTGRAAAENVQLTSIVLAGGTLTLPTTLPVNLGTIAADGSAVVNADFTGQFAPLGSYPLELKGTYTAGGAPFCFTLNSTLKIPPAAPGSAPVDSAMLPSNDISGAPFPHRPPDFDDEVNVSNWAVPTAPFVAGEPPPGSTGVASARQRRRSLRPRGTPAIVFEVNNGLGFTGSLSTVAEPSGASGGGVIFITANWTAAYSTDGGNTFTQLDPTTIFPNDEVGYCCDQVVQYVASIDRFVWFLQGNGYRLAVASPTDIINSGGTAWTYWNLTPQFFGQPAGTGLDYPDLSVGDNALYMSWDVGFPACPMGCSSGFQVARTSLAGIGAGGTITVDFTNPPDGPMAWGSHLMQDTGDEIFWAGHNSNSNMRVFSLQEGSNTYFWRDVGLSTWANNARSSTTPDGQDWLAFGFPGNGVIGSTRVGSQLWFAWMAGTDDNFRQAHIEMVTLDHDNDFHKDQQVQIWNDSYAFGYPALATNACTHEVGLSFEFGGGGNYENHVVGFWGDFVAYITTASDVGTNRFGDYVSIRQAPATDRDPGNLFTAFGYGLNNVPPPGAGTNTDVHYVLFGRPRSSCEE